MAKKVFTDESLVTLVDETKAYVDDAVSTKANSSHNHDASNITSGTLDSDRLPTIQITKGGTGATTAAAALTNLGITATSTELNYMDGVTSNVQTQLNGKANSSHNHTIANINGLQDEINNKLDKLAYEWNKEISFGGSGYLCIGKFGMYDSNITVDIDSTAHDTYHATLVIATQNINTSLGGHYSANVYGDATNTVAPNLFIEYVSGSNVFSIYFQPSAWSKNLIHIRGIGVRSASNICTNVSSIPSTATIKPTNVLQGTIDNATNVLQDAINNATYLNVSTISSDTAPKVSVQVGEQKGEITFHSGKGINVKSDGDGYVDIGLVERKIGNAMFDGTSDIEFLDIQGYAACSGTQNLYKNKYTKFARVILNGAYAQCSGTLKILSKENHYVEGELAYFLRNDDTASSTAITLNWTYLTNADYEASVVAVKIGDGGFDLYFKPVRDWETILITNTICSNTNNITFVSNTGYVDSVTSAATSVLASKVASAKTADWATSANASTMSDSVLGVYDTGGGKRAPNAIGTYKNNFHMGNEAGDGYQDWIHMNNYSWSDVPYATMIGVTKAATPSAYIASGGNSDDPNAWTIYKLLDSNNYKDYISAGTKLYLHTLTGQFGDDGHYISGPLYLVTNDATPITKSTYLANANKWGVHMSQGSQIYNTGSGLNMYVQAIVGECSLYSTGSTSGAVSVYNLNIVSGNGSFFTDTVTEL